MTSLTPEKGFQGDNQFIMELLKDLDKRFWKTIEYEQNLFFINKIKRLTNGDQSEHSN